MKSGFDIEWTFEAKQNLNEIFDYLETTWTGKEVIDFAQKLETYLQIISFYPKSFPLYDKEKNIRRCVLSKQTTIYYCSLFEKNKIVILTLFDNRSNPEKIRKCLQ